MKPLATAPFVGVLSLAAMAWAQEGSEPNPPTPIKSVTPITTSTQDPAQERPTRPDQPFGEAEAEIVPGKPSDSVPLPNVAVTETGPDGDRIVTPASGNPYFLSFVAGPYSPPESELVDPNMLVQRSWTDLRPTNHTYGMVMFQKRITEERLNTLKGMGCRVLEFHPHYAVKVAIPENRILDVSTLDFVRWVGQPREWQKIHTALSVDLEDLADNDAIEIYLSVFESDLNEDSTFTPFGSVTHIGPGIEGEIAYEGEDDPRSKIVQSNGWMQQALEARGVTIHEYRPDIHTFRATITKAQLADLTPLDFVQFIEPVPTDGVFATPIHDESIPMVFGDVTRASWDGSANSRASVGIVDSGVENAHQDISGIFGWGWNCTTETSAWNDTENGTNGHGTHVTGTILGDGSVEADHTGMAPGVARFSSNYSYYNYRKYPSPCSVGLSSITSTMSTPVGSGVIPHAVNNSWGSWFTNGTFPSGTEADARTVDNVVYNEGQAWVFSTGNFSTRNISIQSAAKNSIGVGSIVDYDESSVGTVGDVWSSSGAGPTADGRFKPNVVAPGRWVSSALANNNTGYAAYNGTSMASPHVTGLIAQLVDHHAFFDGYLAHRLNAHLMATATARDDAAIRTPSSAVGSHLNTQGAGRINSYRAHNANSNWGWLSWSYTQGSGQFAGANFTLPANTTRLVAVMHYTEAAASSGAGQALVNDFDFTLDQPPIDPGNDTGEWFAQHSSVDNTEIRVLTNPLEGEWRWKIHPDSTSSSVLVGVTILWHVGDTTPTANVSLSASDSYVQVGEVFEVTATVDPNDQLASAVLVDLGGSMSYDGRSRTLGDGIVSDLSQSGNSTDKITLGDVYEFLPRSGSWDIHYNSQGVKTISLSATSDNMVNDTDSIQVTVDSTQPTAVSNLTSPSHTLNQWSNDPTIQWTWTAASDALSGLQGYGIFESTTGGEPGNFLDIGTVTSYTSAAYASSTSGRYFAIKSVDNADNWDTDWEVDGPYFIDTVNPGIPAYVDSTVPQGASTCEDAFTVQWSVPTDIHSGVAGYSLAVTSSPGTIPNASIDVAVPQSMLNLVPGTWYYHVRAVDNAGNVGDTAHFGPFIRTADCGTPFCNPGNPNSTGFPANLYITGSDIASANDLTLNAEGMPLNNFGYFICGTAQGPPITPPGSQGVFCLGGAFGRFNAIPQIKFTGATGTFDLTIDLTSMPTNPTQAVMAGQSWSFQAWHRDQNPFNTSNFTNGVTVTFK